MTPDKPSASETRELLSCPWCKRAMMFRKALHVSDGNTDAIIHRDPCNCPMPFFDDGTTDESIIAKWNTRTSPAPQGGERDTTCSSPAATASEDIIGWRPQFEMMKLEARPPDGGDWIPIFPSQLQAMANNGNDVRALTDKRTPMQEDGK